MDPAVVISSLQRQVDCYRQLAKLAELQHQHVQQDQSEALLDVLQTRKQLLDQISAIERTISPMRRSWGEFLEAIQNHDRAEAEALLGEARKLLGQITAADRNDVLVLQQRKLNLGRQIRLAQAARLVNRNYAATAGGAQKSNMDVQR